MFIKLSGHKKIEKFQKECESLDITPPSLKEIEEKLLNEPDLRDNFIFIKKGLWGRVELRLIADKDFSTKIDITEIRKIIHQVKKFKDLYTLTVKDGKIEKIHFDIKNYKFDIKIKDNKIDYYLYIIDINCEKTLVYSKKDIYIDTLNPIKYVKNTLESIVKAKNLNGQVSKSKIENIVESIIEDTLGSYECGFYYGYHFTIDKDNFQIVIENPKLIISLKSNKKSINIDPLETKGSYEMDKSVHFDKFLQIRNNFDKVIKRINLENIKILNDDFAQIDDKLIFIPKQYQNRFTYKNQTFVNLPRPLLKRVLESIRKEKEVWLKEKQNQLNTMIEKITLNIDFLRVKEGEFGDKYQIESGKDKIVINESFDSIELETYNENNIKVKLDTEYITLKNRKLLYKLYIFMYITKYQSKTENILHRFNKNLYNESLDVAFEDILLCFDKNTYNKPLDLVFEYMIYPKLQDLEFDYNNIKGILQTKVGEYLYVNISKDEIQIHHSSQDETLYMDNLSKFFVEKLENIEKILEELKTEQDFKFIDNNILEGELEGENIKIDIKHPLNPVIKIGNKISIYPEVKDLRGALTKFYCKIEDPVDPNEVLQNFIVNYKSGKLKIVEIDKVNKSITFEGSKPKELMTLQFRMDPCDFIIKIKELNKDGDSLIRVNHMQENRLFFNLFLLMA